MADILIKGLEMPKYRTLLEINPDGTVAEISPINNSRRRLDATAISVSNHGRLIDADRLKGIIRKANEDCMFVGKYERAKQWYDAEFYVDHAPTVLEASNGHTY